MKSENKKNNKKLLLIAGISSAMILGGTLAYFTTSNDIANSLRTGLYQHSIVETFESPTNWTPGTTTNKTVKVSNNGNVPMALRASYTERWINNKGEDLPLKDGKTITVVSSGEGYDNAQYYLTITIDTVQYDQAANIWN